MRELCLKRGGGASFAGGAMDAVYAAATTPTPVEPSLLG
jgi:hypothetical protein